MPHSLEVIKAIARHHGVEGEPSLIPTYGMVNEAWIIGDFVLRIIQQTDCDDEAQRESIVVPLAVSHGVKTPELVAFDASRSIATRPYTLYRKAKGEMLALMTGDPMRYERCFREIGHEIALINRMDVPGEIKANLGEGPSFRRPRKLDLAIETGKLPSDFRQEIDACLDQLERQFGTAGPPCFLHRDIHPWNAFIDPETYELTAIIDWGDASWGEPSIEFASMPLVALPTMLEGYREAGGTVDDGFLARSLFSGVTLAIWELCCLDPDTFDRQWWRMPLGGWSEMKALIESLLSVPA